MGYKVEFEIKELDLKIPLKDFPLKSDIIIGYENPKMKYFADECDEELKESEVKDDYVIFNLKDFYGDNCNNLIEELEELCIKYKGTLIVELNGEDGDKNYVRVREGVKKNIKIIEED